jgi:hypothetical protein
MVVRSVVVLLIAAAGLFASVPPASAELVMVRVVGDNVAVKTRPSRIAETLARPQSEAVLEVLSKEGSWFWVLIDRDSHGTQRAGWVRESDVAFVNNDIARFFVPAPPIGDRDEPAVDEAAPATEERTAEEVAAEAAPVPEAKPVQVAKVEKAGRVEKPKKVDDRRLRKAAAEFEKALQAYEKLQFSALAAEPVSPVGEPIVEPLYQLQN